MKYPKSDRFSFKSLGEQIASIGPIFLLSIFLSSCVALSIFLLSAAKNTPMWMLTKDPAYITYTGAYIGMLSNLSVLFWVGAAAICFFTATILRQRSASQIGLTYILASGTFSIILGLDDLFMWHERILPKLLHIPESIFYLIYLGVFLIYILYFSASILKSDYLLFIAAMVLLGGSRMIYPFFPEIDRAFSLGDMLKFAGIVLWLAYFYRVARQELNLFMDKKLPV